MNAAQRANVDAAVRVLAESLFSAWSYLHLLRGLHEGGRANPAVLERYGWLFDQVWRGIFDGFFAKVGTLLDRTTGTHSLPNLVTLIRRYGDEDLKQLLPEVEACLAEKESPLAKIKNWRHEAVAHRSAEGRNQAFYTTNKLNLIELADALVQLEEALNHLSWHILGIHNDIRSGNAHLLEHGRALFESIATGIASENQSRPAAKDGDVQAIVDPILKAPSDND